MLLNLHVNYTLLTPKSIGKVRPYRVHISLVDGESIVFIAPPKRYVTCVFEFYKPTGGAG